MAVLVKKHLPHFFIILFLLGPLSTSSFAAASSEQEIKAAFLYHFLNFIEWPQEPQTYRIYISGDVKLRDAILEMSRDKTAHGKPIEISSTPEGSQVLIMPAPPIVSDALTIGSIDDGALLEFRMVDNKLKFIIDEKRMKESRLKISSQLLRVAELR